MALSDEVLRNVQITGIEPALRIQGTVVIGATTQQLETSQDLSLGSLNYTTNIGSDFLVNGVYFDFESEVTQTISLEYNSVEIFKTEIESATNVFINTEKIKIFGSLGKELTIKCTNTDLPEVEVDVTIDIEVI